MKLPRQKLFFAMMSKLSIGAKNLVRDSRNAFRSMTGNRQLDYRPCAPSNFAKKFDKGITGYVSNVKSTAKAGSGIVKQDFKQGNYIQGIKNIGNTATMTGASVLGKKPEELASLIDPTAPSDWGGIAKNIIGG